jgi:hypothetical protein
MAIHLHKLNIKAITKMSHKAKNIIILFLLLIVGFLLWTLFDMSYGRYCTPIIKNQKIPVIKDSTHK